MPVHCCAMQGRVDAMQALLFFDTEGSIRQNLAMESQVSIISSISVISNTLIDCEFKLSILITDLHTCLTMLVW